MTFVAEALFAASSRRCTSRDWARRSCSGPPRSSASCGSPTRSPQGRRCCLRRRIRTSPSSASEGRPSAISRASSRTLKGFLLCRPRTPRRQGAAVRRARHVCPLLLALSGLMALAGSDVRHDGRGRRPVERGDRPGRASGRDRYAVPRAARDRRSASCAKRWNGAYPSWCRTTRDRSAADVGAGQSRGRVIGGRRAAVVRSPSRVNRRGARASRRTAGVARRVTAGRSAARSRALPRLLRRPRRLEAAARSPEQARVRNGEGARLLCTHRRGRGVVAPTIPEVTCTGAAPLGTRTDVGPARPPLRVLLTDCPLVHERGLWTGDRPHVVLLRVAAAA